MSKKRAEPTPEERWNLKQRRIGLGLFLLLAACAAVGTQGPWWSIVKGGEVKGEPMYGNDYRRYKLVPKEGAEGPLARYMVDREEQQVRPATIALFALVVALLIAGWDLAADATLMWPLLLASLTTAAVAGFVLKGVLVDESVIKEFIDFDQAKRYRGPNPPQGNSPLPALRLGWGLALFVSSALVLLIDSIYLTVIARRAGKST